MHTNRYAHTKLSHSTLLSLRTERQIGALNILLIPFVLMTMFFIGAAIFGFMAFIQGKNYQNNQDQIIAARVQVAQAQLSDQKKKDFAEKAKAPFRTYTSPISSGSITIKYPKTWSAYVKESSDSSSSVDGYFYPGHVPDVSNSSSSKNFALRVNILQQTYDTVLQTYDPYVSTQKVVVRPYQSSHIPGVIGVQIVGRIQERKQGSMIIMPLRGGQTLELWTEDTSFQKDFNDIILSSFSFVP